MVYISNQADWDNDADLHALDYEPNDRLIDSQGTVYTLHQRENQPVTPQLSEQAITLTDVTELVKAHLSELGSCCVSKMHAATIDMAAPKKDEP